MKLAISTLAALGVLGAAYFLLPEHREATAAKVGEAKESPVRYELSVVGREGDCTVVKRGNVEAARANLELTPKCVELMPRLAQARYWQENGEGELRFVAADGRAVVEFFAADGVAYESLKPQSPLIALKAE
ncbi:hypothetical protein [Chelativorans sp.]|uniref:hypothetical protein n=1 Tax=Chelativorans sp. TaxID=2203393 RepID=UPI0028109D97|nr:hypothetical protein [Chelativorans sp.]